MSTRNANDTTRELTCIGCPLGCSLTAILRDDEILVEGNTCKKGEIYAKKEVTSPTRIVTSSIPVDGGELPMVSVKTDSDIPKASIFDVMRAIHSIRVTAPIRIGDVLLADVAGTGSNIIATRNIDVVRKSYHAST